MANKNFVVHNGLTVGALNIDAATGNLVTTGNINANNLTITSTTSFGGPSGSLVISTNGTADSLRITQVGTGNVLVVEDIASVDSSPFIIDNTGYVISGTTTRSNSGARLTIDSGTDDISATFKSTDANAFISFADNSTGSDLNVKVGAVAGDFTIFALGNERVRVHSNGNVQLAATTAATSTVTGAFRVSGGVGVAGAMYVGDIVDISSTTESSSVSSGALIVDGGAGIVKNVFVGGNISVASATQSTSASTGALIVTGGVGIGANLVVGGNLSVLGTMTTFNSTTLSIQDPLIYVASNNAADIVDIGVVGAFTNPGLQYSGLVRDATDGIWKLFANVITLPTTTVDFTGNVVYNDLQVGNLIAISGAPSTTTATGAIKVTGGLGVTGNITAAGINGTTAIITNISGTLTTAAQPNITSHGTLTALAVSGATTVNSSNVAIAIINGAGSGWGNIGSNVASFNTIFARSTTAQYADLAEVYASDAVYAPGTVVVFGGDHEVTISTVDHDPAVAGVVSTNPGFLMNETADGIAITLQGRVPCQVKGPINKGDRVVTSDILGVAHRLDMLKYQPSCIIGKSLATIETDQIETIEVVVGRV